MALDVSSFSDAIKEYCSDDQIVDLTLKNNVFQATLETESYEGTPYRLPCKWGNGQGVNPDFSLAQTLAAATNTRVSSFDLTNTKIYGFCDFDTEVLRTAKSNVGAFMRARTSEIDGIFAEAAKKLEWALFRSGYGKVGVVGSISSATVTLETAADANAFEKGMMIVFAAAEASGALRDSGDYLTVASVDRNAGTVTFTGNVSGVSGATAGDTMFIRGFRQDAATPARLIPAGLEAWLPASAPSSTAFFGVDRTQDSRLYGLSYDGSGVDVEAALIEGMLRVAEAGGQVDTYLISYTKYATLTRNLQDLKRYIDVKVGEIGFRGLTLQGPHGETKIMPSWACPVNRAFGLTSSTWKMVHLGDKPISLMDDDGNALLRRDTSDSYQVRAVAMTQLGCSAPSHNINVIL